MNKPAPSLVSEEAAAHCTALLAVALPARLPAFQPSWPS